MRVSKNQFFFQKHIESDLFLTKIFSFSDWLENEENNDETLSGFKEAVYQLVDLKYAFVLKLI